MTQNTLKHLEVSLQHRATGLKHKLIGLLASTAILLSGCHIGSTSPTEDQAGIQSERAFVDALLQDMTLAEKVGQMVQAEIKFASPEDARDYHLGSVLNGGGSHPGGDKYASVEQWRAQAQRYHQASISHPQARAAVPVLWGTDAVHGHNNVFGAVVFPHNIGLGAANNPSLTRAVFAATARDVRATGIGWAFSPTVAVARDDRWGRTYESFSEDPGLVSIHAREAVLGLQGSDASDLRSADRVVATAKHFIGDGGTDSGIDQGDMKTDESALLDIHGQSFIAALDANVQTVMASFNSWNGEKIHGHQYALNTLLKEKMGFDGFVIGDWNGHAQIPGCSRESCPQAVNAGIDMFMAPEDWKSLIANTIQSVENGEIARERIDDAVRRILTVKYRAGLFGVDNPADQTHTIDINPASIAANRTLARQAVRESLVLLKNNDKTLPIASSSRVLVIGAAANSIAQQTGGWTLSWQGDDNSNSDFPNGSTILAGIEQVVSGGGGTVSFVEQISHLDVPTVTSNFDSVIYVFGEQPYAEGAGDLAELLLPNKTYSDLKVLRAIAEQGVPLTSILVSGRPLSANAFINASDAFVAAWLPGSEGAGVADVIIGDKSGAPRYNFSGKLGFSWPESSKQSPINAYPNYREQPQFAFGYGLDYTSALQLAALAEHDELKASNMVVTESMPIFSKKVFSPWSLYVGDEDDWGVMINGNQGSTANKETVIISASDNATQEDARRVRWSSDRLGQVYFSHKQGVDMSQLVAENAALQFNVRVEVPPESEVMLRMDCHYPCSGGVDVTQILQSMPSNEWQSVAINLSCFEQSGAEMSQINTPFLMATAGELALEVSHIVVQAPSTAARQIECPDTLSQVEL